MLITDRETLGWTFLSNHTHVLLCLANDPTIRQRDIALSVGITERSVGLIIADLVDAGYVEKHRSGRRNEYTVNRDLRLRHPLEAHHSIGELLDVLSPRIRA
jgi:DNA-binding MarR family transcriptional regulator